MSTEAIKETTTTIESNSADTATASTSAVPTSASATVKLGQGYDTFSGAGKDSVVSISETVKTGAGSELDCTFCMDQKTLSESLRLSASASASSGNVGGDAKVKFSQSLDFSSTSVAVIVYSSSIRNTESAFGVTLQPPDDGGVDSFVKKYGDSYVNQIATGGEYLAVYLFHAESVEQQLDVYGKVEAELATTSSTFNAKLQASLDTICSETKVRQEFKELILGTSARRGSKSVVDFAAAFGDAEEGEGLDDNGLTILSYALDRYENVATMPASFNAVISNRNLYSYGTGGQPGLASQYASLCALQSTIENIEDTYATYGYTEDDDLNDPDSLGSRKAVIEADIYTLEQVFRAMSESPTTAQPQPTLRGLSWGTPSLNYTFHSAGVYGSSSEGTPFQDVDPDSVPLRTLLKKFNAWGDDVVDKIVCTYSHLLSDGRSETTYSHGAPNDNGKSKEAGTLTLATSERIQKIWGTWQTAVHQINMKTSKGQTFQCPAPSREREPHLLLGTGRERVLRRIQWPRGRRRRLSARYQSRHVRSGDVEVVTSSPNAAHSPESPIIALQLRMVRGP